MSTMQSAGTVAVRTLAGIRLANGVLGLLAPQVLIRRLGTDPEVEASAVYPFRLFGIRNIVLGVDLLTTNDAESRRASTASVIIHGTDLASAVLSGLRGDIPPKSARIITIISGTNTALALISWIARRASSGPGIVVDSQ
jgi:hypothetical protein